MNERDSNLRKRAAPIPVPMTLSVGSGWAAAARDALTVWNQAGSNFRFRSTTSAGERGSCRVADVDRRNVVVWGDDFCGSAWGEGVLAVAHTWSYTSTGEAVDSDVHFNSNFSWSSYRGNLRDTVDFGRVAIHEFGHVLGLSHPDDHGQSVAAIMNAFVSDLDTIQADDIAGVRGIYGHDGGGGGGGGGGAGCTPEDLGTVTGTATRAGNLGHDCVSPDRSGASARYYSFTLDQAASVQIDMVSSAFDTWLALRGGRTLRGPRWLPTTTVVRARTHVSSVTCPQGRTPSRRRRTRRASRVRSLSRLTSAVAAAVAVAAGARLTTSVR